MPSKEPHSCPICHRPDNVNVNQHLKGVHGIGGQEKKTINSDRNSWYQSNDNRTSI